MDLTKTLNTVGRAVFVKYYYVFMNMDSEDCTEMFTEDFSEGSKRNRTAAAKRIFREGKDFEALRLIYNSNSVDEKTRNRARKIYSKEAWRRRFCVL